MRVLSINGRGLRAATVLPVIATLVLVACGGSSSSGGLGSGDLVVAAIAPYTGADAGLGPAYYAACLAAASSINDNGGVGGRQAKTPNGWPLTRGVAAPLMPRRNK